MGEMNGNGGRTARLAENPTVTVLARLGSIVTVPLLGFILISDHVTVGDLKDWKAGATAQLAEIPGKFETMQTWIANVDRKTEENANAVAVLRAQLDQKERDGRR